VISASSDATVRVWDAKTCECVSAFRCACGCECVSAFRCACGRGLDGWVVAEGG
jgi:hypothetical protein